MDRNETIKDDVNLEQKERELTILYPHIQLIILHRNLINHVQHQILHVQHQNHLLIQKYPRIRIQLDHEF